jgi:hypothetical protein
MRLSPSLLQAEKAIDTDKTKARARTTLRSFLMTSTS